jgi:type IV secretion system protein VirB9
MRKTLLALAAIVMSGIAAPAGAQVDNAVCPADVGVRRLAHAGGLALSPVDTLAAANRAARQRPMRNGFVEARHVYSYAPGALYEVYANPSFVSTILLEPGESLSEIAAGDTSRWLVTQANAETEGGGRVIVLVKPQTAGLRTNIVLITDRRTYLVEAISQAGSTYSAQIAWCYPAPTPEALASSAHFNENYRIRTIRGREPAWKPTRVFDDGRRTWIEMAPNIAASDMPPLFVITDEGAELVNYRVQGARYMVDRIFDRAELRLGTRAPIIVRIDRRRGSSSASAPSGERRS